MNENTEKLGLKLEQATNKTFTPFRNIFAITKSIKNKNKIKWLDLTEQNKLETSV